MVKPKIHFSSTKTSHKESSSGCSANSPLASTVHDLYRRFGLCECVGEQRRA